MLVVAAVNDRMTSCPVYLPDFFFFFLDDTFGFDCRRCPASVSDLDTMVGAFFVVFDFRFFEGVGGVCPD